ncbi:MAG TPA: acetaldehyde dehydrogenase (acetylating) [Bacillota bacterium]|nr:acetaldehyde dehydrogenase (acetylating) [Bacillota bacterium]
MDRVGVAIVGPGNIGTDLMYKVLRSRRMELRMMSGIVPTSDGLSRAKQLGIGTTSDGIGPVLDDPEIAIVFDATSAKVHLEHAPLLERAGKFAVDLTPASVGPFVVPAVNAQVHVNTRNVNMVTCGGQATVPIVAAISRVARVRYAEIVATIASKSAGPGTRQNIDEFTETTARAICVVGGAEKGKAIVILNPAEPPIIMRDTVYAIVDDPDGEQIRASVREMVATVQSYVPGYRLKFDPLVEDDKVTVMVEVVGAGDYLPTYSGNLDIMTAAACAVGERLAENLLQKGDCKA